MPGIALLLHASVFCLLGAAAVTDIKSRTIPNLIPLLVLALFVIGLFLAPELRAGIGLRLLGFMIAIGVGIALFAAGAMGGGDIKLLAALSLWHPFASLPIWIFLIGVSGGVLALFFIVQAKLDQGSAMAGMKTSVPYAVAILMGEILLHMSLTILPISTQT